MLLQPGPQVWLRQHYPLPCCLQRGFVLAARRQGYCYSRGKFQKGISLINIGSPGVLASNTYPQQYHYVCPASCSPGTLLARGIGVTTGRAWNNTTFQRPHDPEHNTTGDGTITAAVLPGDKRSDSAAATAATRLFPSQERPPKAFPDFRGEAHADGMLEYQDITDYATLPAQTKTLGTANLLDLIVLPRLDSGTEREILLDQNDLLEHAISLHQTGQLQVAEKVYTVLLQV